jgi:quercetin dioxygenase-like cupin family protein
MRLASATLGLVVILLSGIAFKGWALQPTSAPGPTPLILERSEGEQRARRPRDLPMPTSSFTIKVDRRNGGSPRMWLGTEEIPAGGGIQRHRHRGQDEILLIQTGTAHVRLGTQERDVHAGAVVFIPSGTWVGLTNIGTETMSLAFVFSDPGFDDYLRCTSVQVGEAAPRVTPAELEECRRHGRFEFDGAPGR